MIIKRKISAVGDEKNIMDTIVAVLLAFCPILQHYQGPIYNAALTVIVLFVPYLLLRILPKLPDFRKSKLNIVLVMIIYLTYRVVDHGTSITELGQSGVLVVYMVAVAFDCIDLKTLCRSAMLITMTASVLLVLQYIGFYLFQYHIQLVPTNLLLPSASQWVLGAQTGLAGITGVMRKFYRPSAFFLEPSHLYIYSFPHLFILLFGVKDRRALCGSVLITMGLVLSTSGMGIAAVAGAWALYLAFGDMKTGTFSLKNIARKRNLLMLGAMAIAFAVAVIYVPSIRRTVTRIISSSSGNTAIAGRISKALRGLENLTFLQWIIGVEDTTHSISYNMPGLIAALYRHGLLGMIMSIEIYVKSLYKLKLPFCLVSAVILVTSLFSAHTHSTVGMLYYILILLYGYQTQRREAERLSLGKKKPQI